ncbi:hypothetical protein [Nocardioides sp.]|uniref:hypothetical protein n=1 Tax=Nocardioides sp. TaxID=35761 RepID=UPI0039E6B919
MRSDPRYAAGLLGCAATVLASLLISSLAVLLGGLGSPVAAAEEVVTSGAATTASGAVTETATGTATATATETVSATPSETATATETASSTVSETVTATGTATETVTETVTASAALTEAFDVADASLRWGLNNESNNRAFAPGTFNFLSAGKIANPGAGGLTLSNAGATWSNGATAGWSNAVGNVSIEKYVTGTGYTAATWAGLSTDSSGATISSPTSGSYSNHQVVLTGGTGEVDPAAGTATISWDGDFTVLYYSGMTFFYVSDPVLSVVDGVGTLTATLGGYGTSMDDTTQWETLTDTEVTLADLGAIDLTADLGFTVTPAYLGVAYSPPSGGAAQLTDDDYSGSFPQSFVDFQQLTGQAAYWYSSGGSVDKSKPTLPLTVSYDASDPVAQTTPASTATTSTKTKTATATATATATTVATITVATATATPAADLAAVSPVVASTAYRPASGPMPTVLPVAAEVTAADAPRWPWWAGAVVLLAAAVLTVTTAITGRQKR